MKLTHLMLLTAAFAGAAACSDTFKDDTMLPPPVNPNKIYDKDSLYFKAWPGQPGLFRLKENLILQIPPQFHQFWTQRAWLTGRHLVPRAPMALDQIPEIDSVGFYMFMPDFGGYTPENYQNPFDADLVEVIEVRPVDSSAFEPGAAGWYPPNVFERAVQVPDPSFDPTRFQLDAGLRCYDFKASFTQTNRQWCYGLRDETLNEYIFLYAMRPPYADHVRYPNFQTTYASRRYGGTQITWRSQMKNFARWKEIDEQIWKYIDAWNIAPKTPASSSTSK